MERQPKQAGPVLEAARAHGLELEVREFPAGTTTAADAARAVGCDVERSIADAAPLLERLAEQVGRAWRSLP